MLLACVRRRSGHRSGNGITRPILGLVLAGATLLSGTSSAQSQTLDPELLRQMVMLDQEKKQRTLAQKKLDSQLIFALKKRRHDPLMARVTRLRTDIEVRSDGATLVDLTGS